MKKFKKSLKALLTSELREIFNSNGERILNSSQKEDKSIVTEIDLLVSTFIKECLVGHPEYKNYSYYSEEDIGVFTFPCAIVDPIDGTRELAKGRAECAVSLALMKTNDLNDPNNYAWIYNPFSGFSLDTESHKIIGTNQSLQKITGLVSRSEFHKGHYSKIKNELIQVAPRGSIAFKLGLLAAGACDFVVSKEPKNVWDIAAGTILCHQRNIHFYVDGKRMTKLENEKYTGVLIWASEGQIESLYQEFKNEK